MSRKNPSKPQPAPQLDLLFRTPEIAEVEPAIQRRNRSGRTWLVRQLVAEARELVEAEFVDVWVEGEISNCRPATSGHLYFTLKDAEAQLPVVLFRRQAVLLRFRPEDGLQVRVRGKASVYEQRGQLQLVAETMEPVGAGSLQAAFEQLRDKLKAEGLFGQERKRTLPAFPRTVAIVTSPAGAAVRDFLNIVRRRHSGLNVIVVPAAVQGENSASEIEAAIALASRAGVADLIVLARGGGSLEDLAAFNSERVARAIAAAGLPVVSAVGHETDFTIADFVADLRAPTPSAAAELITEAQHRVEELVSALQSRVLRAARFQWMQARQRFARVSIARAEQRVTTALYRRQQRLDDLGFRLEAAVGGPLLAWKGRVGALQTALLRHDPRRKIGAAREVLAANVARMHPALDQRLAAARHERHSLEDRLYRAAAVSLAARRSSWSALQAQLHSLSPMAVVKRGYALVEDERGKLIRSVEQVAPRQMLRTRLADGGFASTVTAIEPTTIKPAKKDKQKSK